MLKNCQECQSEFTPARKEQTYCSKSCASVRKGKMRRGQKTGPRENWAYKKHIDQDGYVRLYAGNHPFAMGRMIISEHVLVMEVEIGRRIYPNECVHHKDGNRQNNSLGNLELMTWSEHSKLHGAATSAKRTRNDNGTYA